VEEVDERQVLRWEAMLWEMQLGSTPILRDRKRESVVIAEEKIQEEEEEEQQQRRRRRHLLP
jgi:hypothetical protein